jgi:hypothetical protein
VDHLDLRRRRGNRAGPHRNSETPRQSILRDPLVLLGTGFALGSAVSFYFVSQMGMFGFGTALPFLTAVLLLVYALWLKVRKDPVQVGPRLGSEKQLLLAILDAGGSMTPVEAALETSLTVDEAEEILTRFADRGHLVVQSRDGALFYTLPGRRTSEPQTL